MRRKLFSIGFVCLMTLWSLTCFAGIRERITGPWLWMIAPTEVGRGGALSVDVDSLAIVSNGAVTESSIAANGANEGDKVGDLAWTLGTITDIGSNNINDLVNKIGLSQGDVNDHSAYALITLESATPQKQVMMRVGSDDAVKVWLNGEVVHRNPVNRNASGFLDKFSVNLKMGDNLLLVKVSERQNRWSMFVGIAAVVDAVYKPASVSGIPPVDVVPVSTASTIINISPSPLQSPALGKQFLLNINITGGENIAGYQLTLHFDSTALHYVSSSNAGYLPAGAFVVPPLVSGNQVTLAATSLNGGSQGDGTLATVVFEVVDVKTSTLALSEVRLTDTDANYLSVSFENGEIVESARLTEPVISLTPSPVESPALGEQLTFSVSIMDGKNIAGYAFRLEFDTTALRYVSSSHTNYLPTGAFVVPPLVSGNQVTLAAASPNGEGEGAGTLTTVTFEVVAVKPSILRFSEMSLTDGDANALAVSVRNGKVIESVRLPADVNGDGVVDLEDMGLAAARLGQTGENTADVNDDDVVDEVDLLLIAAAIERGNGAPSLHAINVVEVFTAADVRHWLWLVRQEGLTDAKYQRGILLLEQLLAILTPKETAVLPNYPNPFNPETWIPYHLSEPRKVHISIYAADGRLVRVLSLGHQAAGIYDSRGRAAYWDGRNDLGESVASGVYFYTLTAGDFAATRRMLIRK